MKKFFLCILFFAGLFALTGQAISGGCVPGDPCYEAPKPEWREETAPVVIEPKAAEVEPVPVAPEPVEVEPERAGNFYATIGGGYSFLEKDEEILGHQVYEIRVGYYRLFPKLSAEFGVGYLPDVRDREHPSRGSFALGSDTSGVRLLGDLLIHFHEDIEETFDPYLALGAGVNIYDDALADGHSDVFGTLGLGSFIKIDDDFFIKPDYRIAVVGENTEVNHYAMIGLGMMF